MLVPHLKAQDAHALPQSELLLTHNRRHARPRGPQERVDQQQSERQRRRPGACQTCEDQARRRAGLGHLTVVETA